MASGNSSDAIIASPSVQVTDDIETAASDGALRTPEYSLRLVV
jgi:hypothetical protein